MTQLIPQRAINEKLAESEVLAAVVSVCAWCPDERKPVGAIVTHGICPACSARMLAQARNDFLQGGEVSQSRLAHNQKIAGANPAPATNSRVGSDEQHIEHGEGLAARASTEVKAPIRTASVAGNAARTRAGALEFVASFPIRRGFFAWVFGRRQNRRGALLAQLLALSHREWGFRV